MTTRFVLFAKAGALVAAGGLAGSGLAGAEVAAGPAPKPRLFDGTVCPSGYASGGIPDSFSDEGDADPVVTLDRHDGLTMRIVGEPLTRHIVDLPADQSGRRQIAGVYVGRAGVTLAQVDVVFTGKGWQIAATAECTPVGSVKVE